jgi:glycosyltransferase involved in cell wall biosynthesis
LIIVDDASQDDTARIAKPYASHPQVQLHVNERNLGNASNRNRAASFSQGKYIKYVDSDDVIYPSGLEVMVHTMEQFPQAVLGICRTEPVSAPGAYPFVLHPEQAYHDHFLGRGSLSGASPTKCIIRTDGFRALGGFRDQRFVEDTELWLRIAARYPVVKMLGDLVWCRPSTGEYYEGMSSGAYPFANYHLSMNALKSPVCPLQEADRRKAIQTVKHQRARLIWRMALVERRPRMALRLYQDASLSMHDLVRGLMRGSKKA